jgi:hypothetical protein
MKFAQGMVNAFTQIAQAHLWHLVQKLMLHAVLHVYATTISTAMLIAP